jgi:UDP-glucose 6-dehydrogenase
MEKKLKLKAREIITAYYKNLKEGDVVTIDVYRPKRRKGKYKMKTLSATARKVKITRNNQIMLMKDVTDKQTATLKSWVGL